MPTLSSGAISVAMLQVSRSSSGMVDEQAESAMVGVRHAPEYIRMQGGQFLGRGGDAPTAWIQLSAGSKFAPRKSSFGNGRLTTHDR